MKLFKCQICSEVLYFESASCDKCSVRLGYAPVLNMLYALEEREGAWRIVGEPAGAYRFCANASYNVCNWLLDANDPNLPPRSLYSTFKRYATGTP